MNTCLMENFTRNIFTMKIFRIRTNLSQQTVENAIKNDIDLNVDTSIKGFFTGEIRIGDELVEYRAYNRENDVTHVGTYFIKDK